MSEVEPGTARLQEQRSAAWLKGNYLQAADFLALDETRSLQLTNLEDAVYFPGSCFLTGVICIHESFSETSPFVPENRHSGEERSLSEFCYKYTYSPSVFLHRGPDIHKPYHAGDTDPKLSVTRLQTIYFQIYESCIRCSNSCNAEKLNFRVYQSF